MIREPFIVYAYQIIWYPNICSYQSDLSNFVVNTSEHKGFGKERFIVNVYQIVWQPNTFGYLSELS